MKTNKPSYIVAVALLLLGFLGMPAATQAANQPGQIVYSPNALRDAFRVNLRDISSTAPFADQIVVMDELPFVPFTVLEAIQGRVPGVRVFTQGFNSYAVVRGWRSPLYVIDGMPVDASAVNMLNPNDVMTIEVHKGFGASFWGMRGGGGAIVVNTRRG
ncbi:MAG: TonB-dependent receptor plug domain-containing protein [Tunicatimonas sp.]